MEGIRAILLKHEEAIRSLLPSENFVEDAGKHESYKDHSEDVKVCPDCDNKVKPHVGLMVKDKRTGEIRKIKRILADDGFVELEDVKMGVHDCIHLSQLEPICPTCNGKGKVPDVEEEEPILEYVDGKKIGETWEVIGGLRIKIEGFEQYDWGWRVLGVYEGGISGSPHLRDLIRKVDDEDIPPAPGGKGGEGISLKEAYHNTIEFGRKEKERMKEDNREEGDLELQTLKEMIEYWKHRCEQWEKRWKCLNQYYGKLHTGDECYGFGYILNNIVKGYPLDRE